jgi:hypothetical protein
VCNCMAGVSWWVVSFGGGLASKYADSEASGNKMYISRNMQR